MANTTNYSWETPDDTDLVKDGAAAIRTLGTAIDTTVFNNASAAIAKTIVDAKGDIIAATAADTVARLAIGSNNQVLTADSTTATGLKWATPAGGGKVLQVVYGSTTTAVANSTSTYADTNLTATITPSSTSSKILVLVSQNGLHKSSANTLNRIGLKVFRSSTEIAYAVFNYLPTSTLLTTGSASYSILDTPATTSATTYKTQFANLANAATVVVQDNADLSTMILMEIGA